MTENHEKLYSILLDVQKQIGQLGNETSKQSEMLISLNNKVAIANGRTSKNEEKIENVEKTIDGFKNKVAGISLAIGLTVSLIVPIIKKYLGI